MGFTYLYRVLELLISDISIIVKLYSPRYPVNIRFQGVAVQLSPIFRVLFRTF